MVADELTKKSFADTVAEEMLDCLVSIERREESRNGTKRKGKLTFTVKPGMRIRRKSRIWRRIQKVKHFGAFGTTDVSTCFHEWYRRTHRIIGAISLPKENLKLVRKEKLDCSLLFFVSIEAVVEIDSITKTYLPQAPTSH